MALVPVSFYCFRRVQEPAQLSRQLHAKWGPVGVKGRVYVADEGVNAQITVRGLALSNRISATHSPRCQVPTAALSCFKDVCDEVAELAGLTTDDGNEPRLNIDAPVPEYASSRPYTDTAWLGKERRRRTDARVFPTLAIKVTHAALRSTERTSAQARCLEPCIEQPRGRVLRQVRPQIVADGGLCGLEFDAKIGRELAPADWHETLLSAVSAKPSGVTAAPIVLDCRNGSSRSSPRAPAAVHHAIALRAA
jgi:hypothetical protein